MTGTESADRTRPRQAVIVAGGRGTRLGSLTENTPKALVRVGGIPFIELLLELLAARGFQRVVLLLGYRAKDIADHCGDGSRWGMQITTVTSDPEDETGRRVLGAASLLDDTFVYMYCDNLWPMPFDDMWRRHVESGRDAMITIYANDDGFTRSNVRVGPDGSVLRYDPTRTEPDLAGVEIGYGIFPRSVLGLLDGANVPFQHAVLPRLVEEGRLSAFVTHHRYYSIGTPERLPITEQYVSGSPAIILDRDGVLNEKPPRATYVTSWDEWRWIPGSLEALAELTAAGYRVFVVSNQAGIGRGVMTEDQLAEIHERMFEEVAAAGGRIDGLYHCPHDWDEGCTCRKPEPGMLFQVQREHHIDLTETVFVGDDPRDALAAQAAGAPSFLVDDEVTLLDFVRSHLADRRTGVTV
ncbi:MAG TPA: HAD-IIIA family hydrolase [Acidimicrobiia bacterium]|nr:HAD-IIIA family hydrolase [Acidimicrobiia bacterium]